jgi:hypothetical protein
VFQLCNIADEESRFYNSLHALPEAMVSLIADLVEANLLLANPYTELRRHLLAAHQLKDIQRVEQLFSLLPLGAQKLLAEMLRLCPRGQENISFFNCLFPNKLPREPRILLLLSEADVANKQALGAREDLLVSHNSKHAHNVLAAVAASSLQEQGEEPTVAAVCPGASRGQCSSGGGKQGGSGRGKMKHGHGGGGGGRQQVSHVVSHVEQARLETGLCFNPSPMGPRSRGAAPPAPGRETSRPGAAQAVAASFPRRLQCFLQHPPTPFFSTCHRSKSVWPGRSTHLMQLRFQDQDFSWIFLLADVAFPSLGVPQAAN